MLMLLSLGCTHRLPISPIKIPVSLTKAGTIINMDFKVNREYNYGFILRFSYKKGIFNSGVDLREAMGDPSYHDKNGNIIIKNVGVPIPCKVTIRSLINKEVVYQKSVIPSLSSWGRDWSKSLGDTRLKKGNYNIVVESVNSIPDFDNVLVLILITELTHK